MKKPLKMIEVNLLPDIKQEVLVARQMRDRVATWAIIISGGFISLAVIFGMISFIVQGLIISSQKSQIKADFEKIEKYTGVSSLLTIQKQLKSLDDLHQNKPVTSRMFFILTQIIAKYKFDLKVSNMVVDPHKKKIVIEGYSETGYVEIERFTKTLNNAKVSYLDLEVLNQISEKATTEKAANDMLTEEMGKIDKNSLLKEEVSLLSDPTLGENSDGKRVLVFKVGLAMDDNFFKSSEKISVIEGASYQDVTDSYLSIPQELFGSIQEDDKTTENKETE